MTDKYHTVRRLNRSRQYIMYLINLYGYLYETRYNTQKDQYQFSAKKATNLREARSSEGNL